MNMSITLNTSKVTLLKQTDKRREVKEESLKNLRDNERKNEISEKARRLLKKNIRKLVDLYYFKRKAPVRTKEVKRFSLQLITLTLPTEQMHSDTELKSRALNSFLQYLRKYHDLKHYCWRAERQGNGNLHFHILTTTKIHHSEIRKIWNRQLKRLGYIDKYRERMRKLSLSDYIELRKKDAAKNRKKVVRAYWQGIEQDWSNPNTTDIKRLKLVRNKFSYLVKYLAKNSEDKSKFIGGKCYDISSELRELETFEVQDSKKKIELKKLLDNSELVKYKVEDEFFTVYHLDVIEFLKAHDKELLNEFFEFLYSQIFEMMT
jgi:hypothetical protein